MRILAISAHPDDETLGCGGALLKHRQAGDEVFWCIATQADVPRWSADVVAAKRAEVSSVGSVYAVKHIYRLGFASTSLDRTPRTEVMEAIRHVVTDVKPEVVYLVYGYDVHTDHQVVFEATTAVLKSFYMKRLGVRRILAYETLSSTEAAPPLPSRSFTPNCYVDITLYMNRKLDILKLYATELQPDPLPRSPETVRSLARFRGASVGVEYAEAFMLIREIG